MQGNRFPARIGTILRAAALLCLLAALPAGAAVTVSVSGNNATANVSLAGGVGADLTLSFSDVDNLDESSLGISAELVNLLDASLLSRLPDLSLTALTSAFPVMITVEPPPGGGLAFSDTVRVEIHTHSLEYAPGTRLRLFKAPLGGAFRDITDAVESGSVRARGRTGGFSQFLVLLDLRPTSAVAGLKFDALEARLADATGLSTIERSALEADLADARAAFALGAHADAIAGLDAFAAGVRQLSGSAIPNRWRAARDVDNVSGDLQGDAASLRYTLGWLRDHGD